MGNYFGPAPVRTANVNGTSKPRYSKSGTFRGTRSKIGWYRKERGYHKNFEFECSAAGCTNPGEYGGHVHFKDPRFTGQWFITPLCPGHNNLREDYFVTYDTALRAMALNPHAQ